MSDWINEWVVSARTRQFRTVFLSHLNGCVQIEGKPSNSNLHQADKRTNTCISSKGGSIGIISLVQRISGPTAIATGIEPPWHHRQYSSGATK